MYKGVKSFENKIRVYLTNDVQIIGLGSWTSASIEIPRDEETFEHVSTKRLFPCAEGAGYAGGIVSAVIMKLTYFFIMVILFRFYKH